MCSMLAKLRAGLSGVQFLAVYEVFLVSAMYRAAFGPNQPPIQWVPWVLSEGLMCAMICGQRLATAVRTSEQGVCTALFCCANAVFIARSVDYRLGGQMF